MQQVFDYYVHGLSLDGRVSVNGTMIERYRSALPPGVSVADAPQPRCSHPKGTSSVRVWRSPGDERRLS
ncbi:MAG: hypothetical protein ACYTFT_15695 [Planctomycetota bacterium]